MAYQWNILKYLVAEFYRNDGQETRLKEQYSEDFSIGPFMMTKTPTTESVKRLFENS